MDAHNLVLWVQRLFTSMNRSFNTLLPLLPLIITPTVATQTLTILRRQLWLNSNFVEDLTRSLNARIKSNKEAIDIIPNITPSVSQFSTFKSHINEIDVAVKKFESNNTPLPVTSQTEFTLPIIIDFGGDISGKDSDSINDSDEKDLLEEIPSRDSDPSMGPPVPRKWKKLARINTPSDSSMHQTLLNNRSRGEGESILLELPNKRHQVSTAEVHETLMVEAVKQPHQSQ